MTTWVCANRLGRIGRDLLRVLLTCGEERVEDIGTGERWR